jgi:alpha-1,3-mannosyltransferase
MMRRFRVALLAILATSICLTLTWHALGNSRPSSTLVIATAPSVSLLPFPSLRAGDPKFLEAAPRYIQAIMNPDDTSFPRLSCPAPNSDRYDYLRPALTSEYFETEEPKLEREYFFALNLYQCAHLLPRLLGSIVETIRFLGPQNCALSIVEGRSNDSTFEILLTLKEEVERIGAKYYFNTSDIDPKAEGGDRIRALAELRNQALLPLTHNPGEYAADSTVVFVNDVSLCMEDLLELVHQRIYQKADMTCAMDWIFEGGSFYDVWVSRGINGHLFFEIPQSGSWDFSENLFWNDPETRSRLDAKLPFQVFACWNGAAAFTSTPLLLNKIKFRSAYEDECFMGEPTLFCKDLWHVGHGRIAVIPSVNVGYDDEQSKAVKERRGYVSDWVQQDQRGSRSALVDWQSKPPELIECVPTYQHPSWVPSDEALERHDNMTVPVQPGFD